MPAAQCHQSVGLHPTSLLSTLLLCFLFLPNSFPLPLLLNISIDFFFPVIVPSSLLSCCLSVSSSTLQSCPWSAINVSGCLGVSEGNPLTQTLRRSRSVKQGSERFKKTGESKFLFQWDCLSCYSMVGGMLSREGIWSNPAGIGKSVWNSPQAVT